MSRTFAENARLRLFRACATCWLGCGACIPEGCVNQHAVFFVDGGRCFSSSGGLVTETTCSPNQVCQSMACPADAGCSALTSCTAASGCGVAEPRAPACIGGTCVPAESDENCALCTDAGLCAPPLTCVFGAVCCCGRRQPRCPLSCSRVWPFRRQLRQGLSRVRPARHLRHTAKVRAEWFLRDRNDLRPMPRRWRVSRVFLVRTRVMRVPKRRWLLVARERSISHEMVISCRPWPTTPVSKT
jgi:hypothetical protein